MLESLKLQNVGPAPEMELTLAPRINVITGDNGLGKSFLLDIAWWALTRTWAGNPALPTNGKRAVITYRVPGKTRQSSAVRSIFRRSDASWPVVARRPPVAGIVVYVRIDGSFSVWDPARNYWRRDPGRPSAYHFNATSVWDGLDVAGEAACEGLERDWVNWQEAKKPQFKALARVLEILSPPDEPICPGPPMRLLLGEGRDRPTLRFGGEIVPVALASAGIRRVLALAYMLVWTWHEHRVSAQLLNKPVEDRVVILFDEPETHLHPRWQRTLLPSLLAAHKVLRPKTDLGLQIIVATHAPLVVASLEPHFRPEQDQLFVLSQTDGQIRVTSGDWQKQGDANAWLTSSVFGLREPMSVEAETAIGAALAMLREDTPAPTDVERVDAMLRNALSDVDRFWVRWSQYRRSLEKRT